MLSPINCCKEWKTKTELPPNPRSGAFHGVHKLPVHQGGRAQYASASYDMRRVRVSKLPQFQRSKVNLYGGMQTARSLSYSTRGTAAKSWRGSTEQSLLMIITSLSAGLTMNRAESRDEKPRVDSFDGVQENSPRGRIWASRKTPATSSWKFV